jgi:hypothetical protein
MNSVSSRNLRDLKNMAGSSSENSKFWKRKLFHKKSKTHFVNPSSRLEDYNVESNDLEEIPENELQS